MAGDGAGLGARSGSGSIGRRLTLLLAGVAALLSILSWSMVTQMARQAAARTQDNVLAASATTIAETLRTEGGEVRLELPYSAFSMLGAISEDRVFYRVTVGEALQLAGYTTAFMGKWHMGNINRDGIRQK